MSAIKTMIKGDKLTVEIDISAAALHDSKLSTSAKNRLIASSGAGVMVPIGDHVAKLNLNLYCEAEGTPGLKAATKDWERTQRMKDQVARARGD